MAYVRQTPPRRAGRPRDATIDERVLLAIRDHGEGLLDGTAEPPGFHQLRRLRYRVEEVEGSLLVHEEVGGGVSVTLRVPTPDPEDHL